MHFVATIVKAGDLFEFAEDQGVADYFAIQGIIEEADPEEHFMWSLGSCFTVTRESVADWNWEPQVKEMVTQYMSYHGIELLVIVTGTDAHLAHYPKRNK